MSQTSLLTDARNTIMFSEIVHLAMEDLRSTKVRSALTALGMVIGTASVILVVTIGLTGKQYIMNLIEGVGANMIYAYYEAGGNSATAVQTQQDSLTVDDMRAVEQKVPGIEAASPMQELHDRISIGGGKERDILILGVSPGYRLVRSIDVPAGRFFDDQDTQARSKVTLVTSKFALRMFGSESSAIGQVLKIGGLPFVIIGTFKERVETFGLSEVADDNTVLIPYTVGRYFSGNNAVKQIFFSVMNTSDVPQATDQIHEVLRGRHRAESVYHVENLTKLLEVAGKSADALTAILLLVALVTLLVGGVGIMNIMLANVRSRIREIGIRKAVGATSREIKLQFLTEAVFISLAGGIVGIMIGLAIPISVRLFTNFHIPISGLSAFVALVVATLIGVIFGTFPATRAAHLDPVQALKYE